MKICQKQQQWAVGVHALLNFALFLCVGCSQIFYVMFVSTREPEQQGFPGRCVFALGRTAIFQTTSLFLVIFSLHIIIQTFSLGAETTVVFVSGSAAGNKVVLFWRPATNDLMDLLSVWGGCLRLCQ